ncbi:MAG: hypothetical protein M3Z64_02705 [Verrucomicrobiota bacterium]|nr:hypothetical protein [Verrucomicrobiota bacterium]
MIVSMGIRSRPFLTRRIFATIATFWILTAAAAYAEVTRSDQEATSEARRAAEAWLSRSDVGDTAGTWSTLSDSARIPKWHYLWIWRVNAAVEVGQFGHFSQRQFEFARVIPTHENETKVIKLRYSEQSALRGSVLRTVRMVQDPDEKWRVLDYLLRPARAGAW